jgi:NitT/TauT family transport system ATP-binding protein
MKNYIEVRNVSKTYVSKKSTTEALRCVTLDVYENEFVSMLGRSGCGKTTLLKIIGGILPKTGGEVLIDGTPVTGPVRNLGMVFQSPTLLKWRSTLKNILLPLEILDLNVENYIEKAKSLVNLTGLEGFEQSFPSQLSGGMQQRVSLCRSLIFDPSLLLMDEPFGALDALTRDEMNLQLTELLEKEQKTVLFVTHNIPEAIFLSDRVIVMTPRPGKVREIVDIDLPRPRKLEHRYRKRFVELSEKIRKLVYAE